MNIQTPLNSGPVKTKKQRKLRHPIARISPISMAVGSVLFLGAVQTAFAATSFTLSLAPAGTISTGIYNNTNFTATVTESGTTATTGTTSLKATLPAGVTFVSGGGGTTGFVCTAILQAVTCNRTTSIAPNAPVAVPLVLQPTTSGTKAIKFTVSGGGAAKAVTSNTVSMVVSVPAFSASLTGPLAATTGAAFSYSALVTNTSTISTGGTLALTSTLPAGLSFVSGSSPTGFTCTAALQVVTCTRATPIAAGASDTVTLTVNPTTAGSKATKVTVSGSGAVAATSNIVTTVVAAAPDLSVSVAQPAPALKATAMSQVQVQVKNLTGTAQAPINVTFTMPANVSAPLKFSRIADHWVCTTSGQVVSCSYDQALLAGRNTNLRIPVTPATNTLGTMPGPFVASVAAATGETNLANNGPINMTPTAAVTALALVPATGVAYTSAYSQPVLKPTTITKYAQPLPNALAPFFKRTPDTTSVPGTDSYTVDIKQVKAQILPPGFPATDVFAYGDPARPDTFTYPAHTIEARSVHASNTSGLGKPVKVQYLNTLTATQHLLPVDHSIHGTNAGEPDIRSVGHLHGNQDVNENSDGYPEAWYSPLNGGQTGQPMGAGMPFVPYNPNPFDYANNQEGTLLWYHDHTLGMTRLNVYAGMAGLYMLRDDNEMNMIANNQLPSGPHEVPLVLQDRMFHTDGSLAYPDITPVGTTASMPSMVPEFFGDVMVVNGAAWPYLQVEPRKYRFRVLNGSNARFYTLSLQNGAATAPIPFQVIGTEGGFLNAPTPVTTITMGPAERYDIIVDFSTLNGRTITLKNAAGTPFGGAGAIPPTVGLHDQIMQFRVNLPLSAAPQVTIPAALRTPITPLVPTNPTAPAHQVMLAESADSFGRILPILGTPVDGILGWMDPVTEHPLNNTVETWEIFNNTVDAHPVHMHDGIFQVLERQAFTAILGANGQLTDICYTEDATARAPGAPCPATVAPVKPALATEQAWKETVIAYPDRSIQAAPVWSAGVALPGDIVRGEVTRTRMKFDQAGQFVWHCHIVEHEDHDMMRPMTVLP